MRSRKEDGERLPGTGEFRLDFSVQLKEGENISEVNMATRVSQTVAIPPVIITTPKGPGFQPCRDGIFPDPGLRENQNLEKPVGPIANRRIGGHRGRILLDHYGPFLSGSRGAGRFPSGHLCAASLGNGFSLSLPGLPWGSGFPSMRQKRPGCGFQSRAWWGSSWGISAFSGPLWRWAVWRYCLYN